MVDNWTEELQAQMQAHPELPVVVSIDGEEMDIEAVMFDNDCIRVKVG